MDSEVQHLMQEIDEQWQAAFLGLLGTAIVSRHDFINAKMDRIGALADELSEHVGHDEAMHLIIDQLDSNA
jgi:hypothetical protein